MLVFEIIMLRSSCFGFYSKFQNSYLSAFNKSFMFIRFFSLFIFSLEEVRFIKRKIWKKNEENKTRTFTLTIPKIAAHELYVRTGFGLLYTRFHSKVQVCVETLALMCFSYTDPFMLLKWNPIESDTCHFTALVCWHIPKTYDLKQHSIINFTVISFRPLFTLYFRFYWAVSLLVYFSFFLVENKAPHFECLKSLTKWPFLKTMKYIIRFYAATFERTEWSFH